MKHSLARLTGLLIVLMLALSGCNLIAVDPIMQIDEDLAALQKDYSAVVATYEGGEVTKEDVIANFLYQYSYYSYMYSYLGGSMDSQTLESIKQSTVETAVQNAAIAKQFDELGLTLDEDKLAEVQELADETYQQAYDTYYANTDGDTEEVRAKQTEYALYADGYTKDQIYAMSLDQAKYEAVEEKVFSEITEVTEEELNAAYEEKVAADEETYADAPGSFESAMTGESPAYWMPEGYRTVKHILLIPEEDVLNAMKDAQTALNDAQSKLTELEDELAALNDEDAEDTAESEEEPRSAEEIQADIDQAQAEIEPLTADLEAAEAACVANVQDKVDEIYAKIEAGEDFNALIEEYGEDPGMENEPTKTRGYYVCADSTNWDENFTRGAMLLEKVGDISETPVVGSSGIHIIRYESDVTPGAVPLDEVRDALTEATLETKRLDHFNAELTAWVEALNPQYDTSSLTVE